MKIVFAFLCLLSVVCCDLDHATNRLWMHSDTNRDGFLSQNELEAFLSRCDEYLTEDHLVTQYEFYHCVIHNNHFIRPYSHVIFKAFDVNNHHTIPITDAEVGSIVNKFDTNGDGEVSQAEFEEYIKQHVHKHIH